MRQILISLYWISLLLRSICITGQEAANPEDFPFFGFISAIFVFLFGTLLTLTVVAAPIGLGSSQEGSRMSTIEEIAAKGEIQIDLHTSFPAERVTDIDNLRSLLYYYRLLTICGTHRKLLKMRIPNNCVHEQYFDFLLTIFTG